MKKIILILIVCINFLNAIGWEDVENNEYWMKKGFTAQEAYYWSKITRNPDYISKSNKSSIDNLEELKGWAETGITDPDKIGIFKKNNISFTEFKKWEKMKVDSPDKVMKFIDKNISVKEVTAWYEIGVEASNVIEYRSKVDIQEARKWVDPNFSNYYARSENGTYIGFSNVEEYKKLGFKNYSEKVNTYGNTELMHIQKLVEWKIKPSKLTEQLSELSNIEYIPFSYTSKEVFKEQLALLDIAGCKTIEKNYFSESDQYDNEGLCYIFAGSLIQRIDRKSGLATGMNGKVFYAKFRKSWREGKENTALGIVQGLGNFTYTTNYGDKKNVPKGKIIYKKLIN